MTTKPLYVLKSAVESHRNAPDTFWIPSDEDKAAIGVGSIVKMMFNIGDVDENGVVTDGFVERMWVEVTAIEGENLTGKLLNQPFSTDEVALHDVVHFTVDHITDIAE